ncbi:MAG: DNA polymerase III subunit delta [Ilumatobacteraceae bacterium]|uniref:DNA polymerase III subunit delta n=1 Tax=freshwater metagenome TaxID=449393 RepID=A0A6J6MDE1_9ZZZZ|nr:DNA polymerase III subunit delta [Ilumatobacteraceae bacterium]
MSVYLISGDESLISLELTTLVDRLVGDNDRSMMVDDFDCSDSTFAIGGVADALTTMSLFMERKVVVLRHLQDLLAEDVDTFVAAIDACIEEVDLVITSTGRVVKAVSDACKRAKAETIGAAVVSNQNERIKWVETKLVEAGFTYSPDAGRLIASWFGGDHARIAGLLATLTSAYGEGAKLSRSDIEVFLGEAGSVAPWDLTDAVDAGDSTKALLMLHRMMGDSHPLQILALLANRYAQMMKIDGRGVRTAADAVEILGGKEFTARKVLEQYQRLGSAGISRAISLIATADLDLRGGKDWEPELVMEVLVARLSRLGGAAPQRARAYKR